MSSITDYRGQVNGKPAIYVMTYLLNAHPVKMCTHAVANSNDAQVIYRRGSRTQLKCQRAHFAERSGGKS